MGTGDKSRLVARVGKAARWQRPAEPKAGRLLSVCMYVLRQRLRKGADALAAANSSRQSLRAADQASWLPVHAGAPVRWSACCPAVLLSCDVAHSPPAPHLTSSRPRPRALVTRPSTRELASWRAGPSHRYNPIASSHRRLDWTCALISPSPVLVQPPTRLLIACRPPRRATQSAPPPPFHLDLLLPRLLRSSSTPPRLHPFPSSRPLVLSLSRSHRPLVPSSPHPLILSDPLGRPPASTGSLRPPAVPRFASPQPRPHTPLAAAHMYRAPVP